MQNYEFSEGSPPVGEYCRLRKICGLSPRSERAAAIGLPNTVVGVTISRQGALIGMGRVVGDGLFYQIVDIAVDPDHQGKGLGKEIMRRLLEALELVGDAEAYVSLIADGEAHALYRQFDFEPVAPKSIGMARWIRR